MAEENYESIQQRIRRIAQELIESAAMEAEKTEIPPRLGQYDSEIKTFSDVQGRLKDCPEEEGEYLGWDTLRPYYRPARGQWTVVTGIPGHGKTSFLDCLIVNMIARNKWKFGIFSAENYPLSRYVRNLLQKYAGVPFHKMSPEDIDRLIKRVHQSIYLIDPLEEHTSLDYLLDIGLYLVREKGIDGLVLDPWNEIEHPKEQRQMETDYISQALSRIRRFSRNHNVHVWVVAHPQKLYREKDGSYPVPGLWDISGSAAWRNKADFGICVWRDLQNEIKPTQIHIQKVRFSDNGKIGVVQLSFDPLTSRYFDLEAE